MYGKSTSCTKLIGVVVPSMSSTTARMSGLVSPSAVLLVAASAVLALSVRARLGEGCSASAAWRSAWRSSSAAMVASLVAIVAQAKVRSDTTAKDYFSQLRESNIRVLDNAAERLQTVQQQRV